MCGIVGYVGSAQAYPILLAALGRLEYRGYDSAGIATLAGNGTLEIRRAKGKLENLRALVANSPPAGHIGIGHTRWATHGRPSEENAHPHKAGPVAVIHNGIVENFVELRTALIARGHQLSSQTDTELVAHLVEERVTKGARLVDAVRETVRVLRGSFSIVVMSETEPAKLVAAKTATPLVIGLGKHENFLASDIPAILEHTRETIVLDDREIAEVSAQGVTVTTFDGDIVTRAPRHIEWDAAAATKGGFKHFLRKEIDEQPQAWIDTLAGRAAPGAGSVRFEHELLPNGGAPAIGRIVILGMG
ncbi:MAG: glutamine--fructose-6-phosphate transaminase (isomerizing), partial [Candidatus Binataceae bacterium]